MYSREQAENEMAAEIEQIERSLSMPSTGNQEQDEARLHHAAVSTAMIAANKCPNGCGEMQKVGFSWAPKKECPNCHFFCADK